MTIIDLYSLLDKKLLDNFYLKESAGFGKNSLKVKIKALKKAAKAEI
jgi:hypothetical protein